MVDSIHDRRGFAERMRLQLAARHPGATVAVDGGRFALRVTGPGVDTSLPLAPLHHACIREPSRASTLIAEYVTSLERQLTPRSGSDLSLSRVLWCVRSRSYIEGMARASELVIRDVAPGLVGFIAEDLPGSIMRGVPRAEWESGAATEHEVRDAATRNTDGRFTKLVQRVRTADRIPADGWRMAGDSMYQSSALVVPAVLAALVERARDTVLIGVPDRGVMLAIPAGQPNAGRFQRRVLQEWRDSMNPCSNRVLVTDGNGLREVPRRRPRAGALVLPWLDE
jgi:hypothetical protein